MDSPEQLRLFIALSVDETVKDVIWQAQQELRRSVPARAARWTRREQFHLTIRFLGNVGSGHTSSLIDSTRAACRDFKPLRVKAKGIGVFPNLRSPRVLWVGVNDLDGQLAKLWKSLQSATQPFTEEPIETDFTGHVTLARINRMTRAEAEALAGLCARFENESFGSWTVDHLELVRSELLPQGARHTLLAELPLPQPAGTKCDE